MKINYQQFAQSLSKSLAPIYLISSDEPLLLQEAVDCIQQAAEQAGFNERVRISMDSADWGKILYADTHSLSLFATKRIFVIDLQEVKFTAANTKILQDYAENPPADSLLILKTHKLDSKVEKSAWYKAIDKAGVTVPIWPISREQLPAWIIQRAKKADLKMSREAAERLADKIEGNLLAAAQEIEKLRLLQTSQLIDASVIENNVNDNPHFDIFALVDSLLAADSARSFRILQSLFAEGTEPVLIVWAITRELRLMADILEHLKNGASLSALFSQYRIWEKRQGSVKSFLKRNTLEKCWKLLSHAAFIDRIIKGAEGGNVKIELERLVLYAK